MSTLITRAEAKAIGATRYFTGKACPQGHVCERMVVNTDCVKCMRIRNDKRYRDNAEYRARVKARLSRNYMLDPRKFRRRSFFNYWCKP